MDTTALDKQLAALRADDERIAAQLASVDAKLTEWSDLVRQVQAALNAGMLTPAAPSDVAPPPPPAAEQRATAPEASPAAPEPPPAEPEMPPEAPPVTADEPTAPPASEPLAVTPTEEAPAPATPAAAEPPPAQSAPPAAEEDDEQLLASLDPDLAKAIRVKRRLTGNRKSIRELLDEMAPDRKKPGKDAGGAASKQKRWWRRAND